MVKYSNLKINSRKIIKYFDSLGNNCQPLESQWLNGKLAKYRSKITLKNNLKN